MPGHANAMGGHGIVEGKESGREEEPFARRHLENVGRGPAGVTNTFDALDGDKRRHAEFDSVAGRELPDGPGGEADCSSECWPAGFGQVFVAQPVGNGEDCSPGLRGICRVTRSHCYCAGPNGAIAPRAMISSTTSSGVQFIPMCTSFLLVPW